MYNSVTLSLGANLGDKYGNFQKCEELIEQKIGKITLSSKIYETKAWGFECEELFINKVIVIETTLSPEELLFTIWEIEKLFGRVREGVDKEQKRYQDRLEGKIVGYLSRYMDIDILFYGQKIINTPILTIPHRFVDKRDFVLEPLCEIMGEFVHPQLNKTIKELYEALDK